jgi:hypothetical protein
MQYPSIWGDDMDHLARTRSQAGADAVRPLLGSGACYVTAFGWESIEMHDGADRWLALADAEPLPAHLATSPVVRREPHPRASLLGVVRRWRRARRD